jgi:AraC-like DNA-binding protein
VAFAPLNPADLTISRRIVKQLMLAFSGIGLDTDAILAKCGLTREDLARLDERVPLALQYRVWEAARQATGQSGIGVRVGELARIEMFGVLGYVVRSSATMGDALLRTARYLRLLSEAFDLTLDVDGDRAVLECRSAHPGQVHPEATELMLTMLVVLSAQITGSSLGEGEVRFAHDAPSDRSHHERVFGTRFRFGCCESSLIFRSETLNLPIKTEDSKLRVILEREAEHLLLALPTPETYTGRVQKLLAAELRGGNPLAENVAAQFGIRPKTLSRRLKEEGTSHRELLDSLRRDLAGRYLVASDMGITDVAFLLGFSDASAFNKAFKRWTGSSPQAYREEKQARR